MVIERFSSRHEALGDVLAGRLAGASRYLRIAGYFRSSLLEVVGEALEGVGEIRVVCNGDLDPHDVKVAKAARDGQEALARGPMMQHVTEVQRRARMREILESYSDDGLAALLEKVRDLSLACIES